MAIKVIIFIAIIIVVFMSLIICASGELNEKVDSGLYRDERLNYYCKNALIANVRYIGNTIDSPFRIKHNDYLSVYLFQDENSFIYIKFLNGESFVYKNKDSFFMEWRLLYDDKIEIKE